MSLVLYGFSDDWLAQGWLPFVCDGRGRGCETAVRALGSPSVSADLLWDCAASSGRTDMYTLNNPGNTAFEGFYSECF
jgi:hypothetical protein